MPAPIFWKTKVLAAKIETTYGTDSVPTGAANAILAMNVTFTPMDGDDVKRDTETPYFAADPSIPVNVRSTIEFDVEMVASGTLGVAPGWGPLLRMCSVAEVVTASTKVEYSPITNAPESGSIYFSYGGTRHVMLGSRGTFQFKFGANGLPMLHFVITGLFNIPTETTALVPTFTAFQAPQAVTKTNTPTFTIGGIAFVMRDAQLDMANQVEPRMLVGSESIQIVDRSPKFTCTVEAQPVSAYNPFTIAQNQTTQALSLIHGTTAATRVNLSITKAQQMRPGQPQVNQNIVEWPLEFAPLPTAGNDEWKLSLL